MITGQWATNVQGMNAPLNIFVRASDRRLLIGRNEHQPKSIHRCDDEPGFQQRASEQQLR
jgi:hypothetical protein